MLALRAELLCGHEGRLPDFCRLPKRYVLPLEADRVHCERCGRRLRRQWTRKRYPVGLQIGEPEIVYREKQCSSCKTVYACEELASLVPPQGIYAYDLIVEVGLARFRQYRQAPEIRESLASRHGLEVPLSTLAHLANRFLQGLAAVQEAYAPQLRAWFDQTCGGYVLHLDGTCEAGTSVVFIGVDGESQITLFSFRIPSERPDDIRALLVECVRLYGRPLATVRDLSDHIRAARDAVLPGVPDFVCECHLLANIGERLLKAHRNALSRLLRQHKLRAYLTATRRDLNYRSKGRTPISQKAYEAFLRNPAPGMDVDPVQLRRLLLFTLIRHIEDCVVELSGEYFPFDQPELVFYHRCREMFDWLDESLKGCAFKSTVRRIFESLRHALAPTRQDPAMVQAARRLELAYQSFQQLRAAFWLEPPSHAPLVRQRPAQELTVEQAGLVDEQLQAHRDNLDIVMKDPEDPQRAKDAAIIAEQLDKYWKGLVGRVITPPGKDTPIVVQRTNNPPEHKFGRQKRGWRRQSGNEKLAKRLDACHPAEFLVDNLDNDDYVRIVYDGSLDNMAQRFAEHWPAAAEADPQADGQPARPHDGSLSGHRLHVPKAIFRVVNFFPMMRAALASLGT